MGKTRLSLTKESVALSLGRTNAPIELRTTHLLSALLLVFSATYTVTSGTGAGTLYADSLYRLFQEIVVTFRGKPLMTLDGQDLYFIQTALRPKNRPQTLPSSLAASTSTAVRLQLLPPFALPHSFDPLSTALPSWVDTAQPPTLKVTMAPAGVVASGEDGNIGFTSPTLDVYEEQTLGEDYDPAIRSLHYIVQAEQSLSSSANAQRLYLPDLAGMEVRGVLLKLYGSDGETLSDSAVTHVRLVIAGQDVQERVPITVIQDENVEDYNLSARMTGFVFLDAADDKGTYPGDLWYIGHGDRPYLEYTATGAAKVKMTVFAVERFPFV